MADLQSSFKPAEVFDKDALLPLMFIIVVDSLIKKLEQECENGNLLELQIARRVKNINHSQFANDTLILGGASTTIASRFKGILDSFLDASGGEVNNRKCQIFEWNSSPRTLREIAQVFQFSIAENRSSFKYLGIPISLKTPYSQVW